MNANKEVKLSDDRKKMAIDTFQKFYYENFDNELSTFRAELVVDFFLKVVGPNIYNQAIQDSRAFMMEKLEDLDVEFYYPEGE